MKEKLICFTNCVVLIILSIANKSGSYCVSKSHLDLTHLELVIIFFHDIVSRKDIARAWKETWTSITHINGEERPTFWINEWLVEDMVQNIQILSLSYDANIYGVNDDVTNIGKNLVQSLVVNQR
jgi:hypothetical protein